MPKYSTQQRKALLHYLSEHPDEHLSTRQIAAYWAYPFVRYALIVGVLIALCSSLLGGAVGVLRGVVLTVQADTPDVQQRLIWCEPRVIITSNSSRPCGGQQKPICQF